jgi:hypothetical protein
VLPWSAGFASAETLDADEPLLCKSRETQQRLTAMAQDGNGAGMRQATQGEIEQGECRLGVRGTAVEVIGVDRASGFIAVREQGQSVDWWIDYREVWSGGDGADKLEAWKP